MDFTDFKFEITYALIDFFCILYALVILTKLTKDIGTDRELQAYRGMVVSFLGFAISNVYWLLEILEFSELTQLILNAINISFLLCVVLFWVLYAEYKIRGTNEELPTWLLFVLFVPLGVIMALVWSSIYTKYMFFVKDGELAQGRGYILIVGTVAVYLAGITISVLVELRATSSAARKRECISLLTFVIMPFFAGILDTVFPNMPIMVPSMFFSIYLIFMNLQESQIFNDSLTMLNNRRSADRVLDDFVRDADAEPFYFFMLDGRNFKKINDTYGHLTGDRVLQLIAQVLKSLSDNTGIFTARWGGDEFVIMAKKDRVEDPEDMLYDLNMSLARSRISQKIDVGVALDGGYAICSSSSDKQKDIITEAEEMMYRRKNAS